jgi:metabolite-proton symporter
MLTRVKFASLIGHAIESFDFYIYGTAAVLVFPQLFFPASDPTAATLQSFATFALAFFARPIGSALFGHFGDRVGRKVTLIATLLTMGVSTVAIGLLPTYATIGVAAPLLLALCRFGQGLGLGGEWGGSVLLAMENAPPGRRAWFGVFPQLGSPLGFFCSTGVFLLLTSVLDERQFLTWGWRIPFLASATLVILGLWLRLALDETPEFQRALATRVRLPVGEVLRHHGRALLSGVLTALGTFVLFYLVTVFALNWATLSLGYGREAFLRMQMLAVPVFGAMLPVAAALGTKFGPRRVMLAASLTIFAFGFALAPLFRSVEQGGALAFLSLGFAAMGFTLATLGTTLAQLFPTNVRYTGASLAFNLSGILGASMAPYLATSIAIGHGLPWVGAYLSVAAALSVAGLALAPRHEH